MRARDTFAGAAATVVAAAVPAYDTLRYKTRNIFVFTLSTTLWAFSMQSGIAAPLSSD
jgi:hypothetical protein